MKNIDNFKYVPTWSLIYKRKCSSNGKAIFFFALPLIMEGTTEKVLQSIMPLLTTCNNTLGFIEQKVYLWTQQRYSNKKKSINWHYFCHKKILMAFPELPPTGLCYYYTNLFCSIESWYDKAWGFVTIKYQAL